MSPGQIFAKSDQSRSSHPPVIKGTTGMVVSGHHLATQAGVRILEKRRNAIDAGVAAEICLGILQSDMVNFAGVAPIMIYLANCNEIKTISGLGPWPKAQYCSLKRNDFELHWFRVRHILDSILKPRQPESLGRRSIV